MKLASSIAFRFLKSGKGQTVLIAVGIAIGVAVQIFIGLLISGLQASLIDKTIGRSPQITITSVDDTKQIGDAESIVAKLEASKENISDITVAADGSAFLSFSDKSAPILLRGLDLAKSDGIYRFSEAVYEGSMPLKDNEVMIGKDLAQKWGVKVGDNISATLPSGEKAAFIVSGLYDLKVAAVNSSWVITTTAASQKFFGYGQGVTSIAMKVKDAFSADTVAKALGTQISDSSLQVVDWKSQNEQLLSGLNGQSISSIMIQVFVLVSVVLGIASVLAITVMQKSRQVGILKAMGLTDRTSSLVFLFQGLFLGIMGAIIGVIFGVGLCYMFATFAKGADGTPVVPVTINAAFIAFSAGIAIAASILASLIPAGKSSKLNPIEVIRNG
jgi:lipoprotein-releasing system permease protein